MLQHAPFRVGGAQLHPVFDRLTRDVLGVDLVPRASDGLRFRLEGHDHHTIFGQCEPASLVKKISQVPATSARPREPITVQSVKFSRRTAAQD